METIADEDQRLTENQHGCRESKSTTTALESLTNQTQMQRGLEKQRGLGKLRTT